MYKLWENGLANGKEKKALDLMIGDDSKYDFLMFKYELLNLIAYHESIDPLIENVEIKNSIIRAIQELYSKGIASLQGYEDIHSYVEDAISKISKDSGEYLRILLSRNEQIHSDLRLYVIDGLLNLEKIILEGILKLSENLKINPTIPGLTHYRDAMPIKLRSYMDMVLSFNFEILDELDKMIDYLSVPVMGYGSGFGSLSSFDLCKFSNLLGLKDSNKNPLLLANLRGFDELRVIQVLSNITLFNSRIAQDLILWSGESGFIELPEEYVTGSSLMPNKKNPDFLEMFIGYAIKINSLGVMTSQALIGKGSWYHREFQILKWGAIESLELVPKLMQAFFDMLSRIKIREDKIKLSNSIYATHNAAMLIHEGKTWKDSYKIIGNALKEGKGLMEFEPPTFSTIKADLVKEKLDLVTAKIAEREGLYKKLLISE